MEETLGHVVSVAGSEMTVAVDEKRATDSAVRLGATLKVRCADNDVLGSIRSVQANGSTQAHRVLTVDLLGEIRGAARKDGTFKRGVTHYPVSGAAVHPATNADLKRVYSQPSPSSIRIGTLADDAEQPVLLSMNDLLAKHFAVLGATGSGKSCAVALILYAILKDCPHAHIMLLDPHNEYSAAFGELADIVNVDNLDLPFWLFDFEEAVRVVVRGGTVEEQEAQAIILKDAITRARRNYAGDSPEAYSISVDTPVPFRVYDLLRFIDEAMGRVNKADSAAPYLRLRARLESLRDDRRYGFMFSDSLSDRDSLSAVVGHLLRIPTGGKPLTIVDMSGVPSEIGDVIVSLACRIMFDFTLWARPEHRPPILLVCEEAHRFAPADERIGFAAASRALTRIAKEGRKYGLSLALVSQRPSELSAQALSQCGTIFALRMGNEVDQQFIARGLPDAAETVLNALPSLTTQQAIVFGEAAPLPTRIRFEDLPADHRPYSESAEFFSAWQTDSADAAFRNEGIRRWRLQSRS